VGPSPRELHSARVLIRSGMAVGGKTRREHILTANLLGMAAIWMMGFGGCAKDTPRATAERPMPAMPTMGPSPHVEKPEIPEDQIVARALYAARRGDIQGALRTLALAEGTVAQASAATKLVTAVADQSPPIAASLAFQLPSGPTRSSAIETAAFTWTQRDPAGALRWSVGIEEQPTADIARRAVAKVFVQTNPRDALDRIRALPTSSSRDEMVAIAAAAWAHQDANGAVAWLRDQPNGAVRDRVASTMAFELAQVSPARAIEMAETLPSGRNRWLVFSQIAQTWVAVDQDAAMRWANRLQNGEARDAAIAGINTGLGVAASRRTPVGTNRGGISRNRSVYAMGPGLDPPAFTAWLATQPQTMSREEAILEFVRQRGSQDSGSIGSWLADLTGEPARQRAMDIYFEEVLRGSPAAAANWLRSLPSSDRRDDMLERTARRWLQSDPTAAAAWLRETPLPLGRQEEILRQGPR
jgi:hypothetical protein